MASTQKVTVTLPSSALNDIRALVAEGRVASVSAFVAHAVAVSLDDVAGWGPLLAQALEETGGALTEEERTWADAILGTGGVSSVA